MGWINNYQPQAGWVFSPDSLLLAINCHRRRHLQLRTLSAGEVTLRGVQWRQLPQQYLQLPLPPPNDNKIYTPSENEKPCFSRRCIFKWLFSHFQGSFRGCIDRCHLEHHFRICTNGLHGCARSGPKHTAFLLTCWLSVLTTSIFMAKWHELSRTRCKSPSIDVSSCGR